MGKRKNYFAIVKKSTGKLFLESGHLPIFWYRETAEKRAAVFNDTEVKPVSIDGFEKLLK